MGYTLHEISKGTLLDIYTILGGLMGHCMVSTLCQVSNRTSYGVHITLEV